MLLPVLWLDIRTVSFCDRKFLASLSFPALFWQTSRIKNRVPNLARSKSEMLILFSALDEEVVVVVVQDRICDRWKNDPVGLSSKVVKR